MEQPRNHSRLSFDKEDYEILELINPVLSGKKNQRLLRNLFDPNLHPRGIKELAAPKPLRIACAVFDLIATLDHENPGQRLRALRAARDEVLYNGSQSLRRNTARVLLQIMKSLVRAFGNERRQLALAHDFREATAGNPRLIRKHLRKYHLLEMPEAWNQMAFDHHVHDANSKGRKSPTHLIMDAWIKGIRHLGVIYYNYVRPEAAAELLEAAEIMDVRVRIGIEIAADLRGKPVQIIWAPRGFKSRHDFIAFLEQPETRKFMERGQSVEQHHARYLLRLLEIFNRNHLPEINRRYTLEAPPLTGENFLKYVGLRQHSRIHLAEFLHAQLLPQLKERVGALRAQYATADEEEKARLRALVEEMNQLTADVIDEHYLNLGAAAAETAREAADEESGPLSPSPRISLVALLAELAAAPRGNRTILNPSNLTAEQVLEVLYLGQGKISHIEIFNVKDWAEERTAYREQINQIRQMLNSGNVAEGKRIVLEILRSIKEQELPDKEARVEMIRQILGDIPRFQGFYRHSHLKSRLGSDSTGRTRHSRGMGLIVTTSLPRGARRRARKERRILPVRTCAQLQLTFTERCSENPVVNGLYATVRQLPLIRGLGYHRQQSWKPEANSTKLSAKGNIATLGGLPDDAENNLTLTETAVSLRAERGMSWRYLNTPLKNLLKVLIGFIPAFLTFYLTKDWWLLAYFGAVIWFAITGGRNIVQSVVGGGGFFRSPLLKWKDFVSWSRVADSLLYTGFSVPLLDYLVKNLLLARTFHVTVSTNALLLYSVMALANGIYISSHNTYRGLPPAAAVGNFFRTILSIPLAIGINALAAKVMQLAGMQPAAIAIDLQLWAAVISKTASDVVAAIIEGLADRAQNLALRSVDYRAKRGQLMEVYGRLEMLFPEKNVLEMLREPKLFVRAVKAETNQLVRQLIVNALDLMYFWMYQPRGRKVFRRLIKHASAEDREILLRTQGVLERKREIAEMFIGGLVGKRFENALAFFLSRVDSYLKELRRHTSLL